MSADDRDDEVEFSMVMPFVVCKSNGGPYDDSAFVAGAEFGKIASELERWESGALRVYEMQTQVRSEMVPQYDLLAMHHDLTLTATPWEEHPDEWTFLTFSRPQEPTDG